MKFLDANIFAYAFYSNERTDRCQAAIREGGLTDSFCLIEAFHIIEKETGKEVARRAIGGILDSAVEVVAVDVNTLFEALKRSETSKLSIFDLIHYASALISNCDLILSYDKDFDRLSIKREEP